MVEKHNDLTFLVTPAPTTTGRPNTAVQVREIMRASGRKVDRLSDEQVMTIWLATIAPDRQVMVDKYKASQTTAPLPASTPPTPPKTTKSTPKK